MDTEPLFKQIRRENRDLGTITPESLRFIRENKMCVVRSLKSVASALWARPVVEELVIEEARLAQIDGLQLDFEKSRRDVYRIPSGPERTIKERELYRRSLFRDRADILKLILSLRSPDKDDSQGLRGLADAFDDIEAAAIRLTSYAELQKLMKGEGLEVAVLIPGHMMHVRMKAGGELVSYSDRDRLGRPVNMTTDSRTRRFISEMRDPQRKEFNVIVFKRRERVELGDLERVDESFLKPKTQDKQLIEAQDIIHRLGGKVFAPNFMGVGVGEYPDVKLGDREMAKSEAAVVWGLARKAVILEKMVADGQRELVKKIIGAEVGDKDLKLVIEGMMEGISEFTAEKRSLTLMEMVAKAREAVESMKKNEDKDWGKRWGSRLVGEWLLGTKSVKGETK